MNPYLSLRNDEQDMAEKRANMATKMMLGCSQGRRKVSMDMQENSQGQIAGNGDWRALWKLSLKTQIKKSQKEQVGS